MLHMYFRILSLGYYVSRKRTLGLSVLYVYIYRKYSPHVMCSVSANCLVERIINVCYYYIIIVVIIIIIIIVIIIIIIIIKHRHTVGHADDSVVSIANSISVSGEP